MRLLSLTALAVVSVTLCAAAPKREEPPYKWTCKAQGFYQMGVAPDGKATPHVQTTVPGQISIVVERRGGAADIERQRYQIFPSDDQYIIGFAGDPLFQVEPHELEASSANLSFGIEGLEKVTAVYFRGVFPKVLTVGKADK